MLQILRAGTVRFGYAHDWDWYLCCREDLITTHKQTRIFKVLYLRVVDWNISVKNNNLRVGILRCGTCMIRKCRVLFTVKHKQTRKLKEVYLCSSGWSTEIEGGTFEVVVGSEIQQS